MPPADLDTDSASAAAEPAAAAEAVAPETADSETEEPAGDGPAKRKRSKRGSRGGRKRHKPVANAEGGSVLPEEPAAEAGEPVSGDGVPEYVPMSEWIEDFDAAKRA